MCMYTLSTCLQLTKSIGAKQCNIPQSAEMCKFVFGGQEKHQMVHIPLLIEFHPVLLYYKNMSM